MVDCNLPLDLDLPEIVASSGGGLCVGCEVESRQKRGSGVGSEWATGGVFQRGSRFYTDGWLRSMVHR
jgi:hypothetical protein